MSNLTLLETILIIYIIVVNVSGIIALIMLEYASKKASDLIVGILFLVAVPITLPMVLLLTFDKLKRRKRKQFDDFIEELEND